MRFTKYTSTLILLILGVSFCNAQETKFSVEQLKADVQFLKNKLEASHPNLYTYTAKAGIDRTFDNISNGITHPLTALEFYKDITVISSVIKDGHTIILPGNSTTDYHNKNSRFLPYHFSIIDGGLFVDMVCTNDTSIIDGNEIVSINGLSAIDIIGQLIQRQVRDGNNETYPVWILNNYFREYYSYVFGHPDEFTIGFKHGDEERTAIIEGLTKDSINYYKQLKYVARVKEKKAGEGITLKYSADNKFAILAIRDFHNEVLEKEYKQNFKKVITGYFEELNKKGIAKLTIDLRDNQGGDITNGALLLSYLIDTPFKVLEGYYEVDNSKNEYGLKKVSGQCEGIQQPQGNVFKGQVSVLINGGSFSNSGIVAACLRRYNRAIFIGEETGGNYQLLAGYVKDYTLPNTGIKVQIPTRRFLLDPTLPYWGQGTVPEFNARQRLDDVIKNVDSILKYSGIN